MKMRVLYEFMKPSEFNVLGYKRPVIGYIYIYIDVSMTTISMGGHDDAKTSFLLKHLPC